MASYSTIEEKREHLKAIICTIVFIVLSLTIYYGSSLIKNNLVTSEDNTFTACSLNYKGTKKLILNEEIDEVFEINDYLFYGEYLNLYHDEYSIFKSDELIGKTITLTNLCDDQQYTYMVTSEIDGHIPVESLSNGFYAISISYQNKLRRAVSTNTIYEEFYTVRRNNSAKKLILVSNKGLLDTSKDKDILDSNFLYLIIEDSEVPEDYYDIVLDPAYSYDIGDYVEKGSTFNDLNESKETYKLANLIKTRLEKFGLKVLITRNQEDELVTYYGENGRLNRAYDSKAKYYLDLQLNSANNKNLSGLTITHSSFCTNKLAVRLKNQICANTELTPTSPSANESIEGVKKSVISNGYDGMMTIRESGGKGLNAATYSEKALVNDFAYNNRYGMHSVSISYMYITNESEALYWQNNLDLIANETANAILSYLDIDYETTNK